MEFRLRNVPRDLYKRIQHIAVTYDRSVNELIIEALQEYAQKHTNKVSEDVQILFQKAPEEEDEQK